MLLILSLSLYCFLKDLINNTQWFEGSNINTITNPNIKIS